MSIVGKSNCFICNTCPIETETFSDDEDGKDSKLFALKVIWEIPPGHLTTRSNGLELCEKCFEVVSQAHQLYLEMVKILEQFRKIQRQLVNEIRDSKGRSSSQFTVKRNDIGEGSVKWREFIFDHEYDFTGPFVIGIGEDYEDDFEFKEESDSCEGDDDQEKADVTEHQENINSCVSLSVYPPSSSELNCGLPAERMRHELKSGSSSPEIINPEVVVEIKSEDEMSDYGWEPQLAHTESTHAHNNGDYTSNVSMEILQQKGTGTSGTSRRNDRSSRPGRKRKLETKTYGGEDDTILFIKSPSRKHVKQVNTPADQCPSTSSLSLAYRQNEENPPATVSSSGTTCTITKTNPCETTKRSKKFVPRPASKLAVCELCEKSFSKTDIRDHMLNHVGEEYLHKCPNPQCPLAYSSSFALYKHLAERNCSDLTQSYRFLSEMRNAGLYSCKKCSARNTDVNFLRAHLDLKHELTEKTHSCPIADCQEKFTVGQSVDVHIFLQHDMIQRAEPITLQKCNTCLKAIRMKEMADHLKITHGAKEIIKCSQCTCLFSSREHLCSHLNADHRYSGVPFICDICTGKSGNEKDGPTFQNHLLLREHYFTDHEQACQKFQCQLCEDKVFWTEQHLKAHMKIHEGFPCVVCNGISSEANVTFSSKEALDRHNIRVHGKEPHKCKFCQMTFTSIQTMQVHVKDEHKGNTTGPIKCEIAECGKVFRTMRHLRRHQTTVHGEIKHVCSECGKGYTTAQGLQNHHQSFHLGYRPNVCECCGEAFANWTALKRHNLIHTGERPFTCSWALCGQKFRHREALSKHLKSHEEKGDAFKPIGPMKHIRKRVQRK